MFFSFAASAPSAFASDPASQEGFAAASWPQYQHDARRSGFTPEEVPPPWEIAWKHDFLPDRPASRAQPIVYENRVYLGTQHGSMYCFAAEDGEILWKADGFDSIQHSCGCVDGKAIFGSLDGNVYALAYDTGELLWKTQTDGPFTSAPLLAEDRVFMGNRRGSFYALEQDTGVVAWQRRLPAPVFSSAAYDQGRVFVGAEDVRVYAMAAGTGDVLWQSKSLGWCMSMKGYSPIVHKGRVIVRAMMSFGPDILSQYSKYNNGGGRSLPGGWFASWPEWPPDAKWGDRYEAAADLERAGKIAQEQLDAQEPVIRHYRDMPEDQDMFIFDAATGEEPFIAPHFRVNSMHGQVPAPVEDKDGCLVVPWVHISNIWARYDIEKNRIIEFLIPPVGNNADENFNVSCGGRFVYIMHCAESWMYSGAVNLETKEWTTPIGFECWGVRDVERIKSMGLPDAGPAAGAVVHTTEYESHPPSIGAGRFLRTFFTTLVARKTKGGAQ